MRKCAARRNELERLPSFFVEFGIVECEVFGIVVLVPVLLERLLYRDAFVLPVGILIEIFVRYFDVRKKSKILDFFSEVTSIVEFLGSSENLLLGREVENASRFFA